MEFLHPTDNPVASAAGNEAARLVPDKPVIETFWPDMSLDLSRTALVLVDPQRAFLDPGGMLWPAVANNVLENKVVEHLEWLAEAAAHTGMMRFVCPHHHDHDRAAGIGVGRVAGWAGAVRPAAASGRDGDIMPQLQPFLDDDKVVVTGSHRLGGLANRELLQELRSHRIEHVILAGMCANLCLEGHLRELVEHSFEVAVVRDATAGITIDGIDGQAAALSSFRLLAHAVWDTREAILRMYGKDRWSAAPVSCKPHAHRR